MTIKLTPADVGRPVVLRNRNITSIIAVMSNGGFELGNSYIVLSNGRLNMQNETDFDVVAFFDEQPKPVKPSIKTMRDEFAMFIAPALYAHTMTYEELAREAYAIADAMMKQREAE